MYFDETRITDEDEIRQRFRRREAERRAKDEATPDDALVHFLLSGESRTVGELRAELRDEQSGSERSEDESLFFEFLLAAAARNDAGRVRELLAEPWADVNVADNEDWTALHEAARLGSVDAATVLIEGGADVNARDDDGATPLEWAVGHERENVVRLLLDAGASDDEDRSALATAREKGTAAIIALLEGAGVRPAES